MLRGWFIQRHRTWAVVLKESEAGRWTAWGRGVKARVILERGAMFWIPWWRQITLLQRFGWPPLSSSTVESKENSELKGLHLSGSKSNCPKECLAHLGKGSVDTTAVDCISGSLRGCLIEVQRDKVSSSNAVSIWSVSGKSFGRTVFRYAASGFPQKQPYCVWTARNRGHMLINTKPTLVWSHAPGGRRSHFGCLCSQTTRLSRVEIESNSHYLDGSIQRHDGALCPVR